MTGIVFEDGKKYLYWSMTREEICKMPLLDAMVVAAGIDANGTFRGWLNGKLTMVELIK